MLSDANPHVAPPSLANTQYSSTSLAAAGENDVLFMYSCNVQHQIPTTDGFRVEQVITPPNYGSSRHGMGPEFQSNPMLRIQTFARRPWYCGPPYVYNGPGSKSSPSFPRTGGTETPKMRTSCCHSIYCYWLASHSHLKGCALIQLRQTVMDGVM